MPYIIGALVLIVLAVGFTFMKGTDEAVVETETVETEVMVEDTTESPEADPASATADYVDGTYTTSVTYLTPARDEYLLDITLTIADDIVTDANIVFSQGAENDPNAQRFAGAYKEAVIGQDIDTLELSRVGGASLTTGAFNNALAEIKTQADA